ncbi:VOC family protein [Paracoccus sp. MBLB3053]|uniref:VOC family protein n=1 Tax=Paracoccus aurantius TaxID=3073814 RepID=A0ABU2HSQ9_9RHOB|nr:VOC family protein [Paracoccus sp. MBLB3053]MDS9468068.1 VOC family protein [Paracoccus sp. MBLB3053]
MSHPPPVLGTLESALYARDLDLAEAFWTNIIGLERIARSETRHVFFRCGAQVLLIFNPDETRKPPAPGSSLPVPPHGTEGEGHFCMAAEADQIEAWRIHLEAQGITVESDFRWPQGGRSIYFRDPAGNSIEIADPMIWGRTDRNRP